MRVRSKSKSTSTSTSKSKSKSKGKSKSKSKSFQAGYSTKTFGLTKRSMRDFWGQRIDMLGEVFFQKRLREVGSFNYKPSSSGKTYARALLTCLASWSSDGGLLLLL